VQTPAWQASVRVQASPSLQALPFAAAGFEQEPLVGSQVPATWHSSDAAQLTGFPPVQTPAWQASVWVQALPSLQAVPFAAAGFEQAPLVGSQVPATWHSSDAAQVTGFPPVQTPAWQASVWVQALPSLQAVPFAAAGFEQEPLAGSQVPATWHSSDAAQVTGFPPVQTPAWQASVRVQASPSLQALPFAAAGFEQAPLVGSQVPATWHSSDAAQVTGFPPVQTPAWQASVRVQASPSLQAVPLAAAGFEQAPLVGSQVPATWHSSDAAQVTGFPPVQTPAWQASVRVQALPSLQAVPLAAAGFEQAPLVGRRCRRRGTRPTPRR